MKKSKLGTIFAIVGILTGIYAVIIGFSIKGNVFGYARNEMAFGADFYTEMYGVTESIRGNTQSINNSIKEGVGSLLIVFGLTDISAFGFGLAKEICSEVSSKDADEQIEM